jgi:hypothetical protein
MKLITSAITREVDTEANVVALVVMRVKIIHEDNGWILVESGGGKAQGPSRR